MEEISEKGKNGVDYMRHGLYMIARKLMLVCVVVVVEVISRSNTSNIKIHGEQSE